MASILICYLPINAELLNFSFQQTMFNKCCVTYITVTNTIFSYVSFKVPVHYVEFSILIICQYFAR